MSRRRLFSIRVWLMLAAFFACAMAQEARAALKVRFEQSGFASLTVTDDGPLDSSPGLGTILYVGSYGTFDLNITFGLSKPYSPGSSAPAALIDLNSSISSSQGGALTITLADTDFNSP